MASMMLGWSEPRLTKQWVMPASQMASKKANDAVYILCCSASVLMDEEVGRTEAGAEAEEEDMVINLRAATPVLMEEDDDDEDKVHGEDAGMIPLLSGCSERPASGTDGEEVEVAALAGVFDKGLVSVIGARPLAASSLRQRKLRTAGETARPVR
jgi:hypothetical protein